MPLKGEKYTDFANGFLRLALEWTATQNIGGNYSEVTAKLYLQGLKSSSTVNASASNSGSITINGSAKAFTATSAITGTQKKLLSTSIIRIYHNADGSKQFNLKGEYNVNITFSGVKIGVISVTDNPILNPIPRASVPTLSAAEFNVGTAITIYTNRASSDYTHTLKYEFGSATGTIATNVGVSSVFNVPASLASQVPNGISGTGRVVCETYSNGTLIGTNTVAFLAWIPDSAAFRPSISAVAIADLDATITTKFGAYVQNKSQLNIKTTAAGAYSSTVTAVRAEVAGQVLAGADTTSGLISTSGSVPVKVTVTDSRNRTATKTETITVLAYAIPTITALVANRVNADGTLNDEGTNLKVDMVATIASLGNSNDRGYLLRYKKSTETTYTELPITGDYALNTSTIIAGADINASYAIELVATDYFGSTTRKIEVSTAFTLMDFYSTGRGLAFGKVAEKNGAEFGPNMPVDFRGQVNIYAPTSTEADGGFLRLRRSDGTLVAFVATGTGGTGLNVHLYAKATNAWSGVINIAEDGSIATTGSITAAK